MHPLDGGTHLLTIGRDGTDTGQVLAPALQLFDVTDPTAPELVDKLVLDDGWSEAENNHKAFTFYQGMLAIPFNDYDGGVTSTLELFTVDPDTGIERLGSIDHSPLFEDTSEQDYDCGYYPPGVRRGVFIDAYVYSISAKGVLVNALEGLELVASLPLPDVGTAPVCYFEGLP